MAIVINLVGLGVLLGGGFWAWSNISTYESTDDAQIDGHLYPISARVAGRVTTVDVSTNQAVNQGQVLVRLDPTDYKVALKSARAELAQAESNATAASTEVPITITATGSRRVVTRARVLESKAGVSVAEQQYAAAQGRVREAEANYEKAHKNVDRYRSLAAKQEISQQQFDQAVAVANTTAAALDGARADVEGASAQVTRARARLTYALAEESVDATSQQEIAGMQARAVSSRAAAQAKVAGARQAELTVQYTIITSPVSGIVGNASVEAGQQVQPGQRLMSVIPLNDLWVTAHFKETQLRNIRIGQLVTVYPNALNVDYKAHIASFGAVTDSWFSLFPPSNASGNFMKVVQRLPVKISFEAGQDIGHMLRPGMSVKARVLMK